VISKKPEVTAMEAMPFVTGSDSALNRTLTKINKSSTDLLVEFLSLTANACDATTDMKPSVAINAYIQLLLVLERDELTYSPGSSALALFFRLFFKIQSRQLFRRSPELGPMITKIAWKMPITTCKELFTITGDNNIWRLRDPLLHGIFMKMKDWKAQLEQHGKSGYEIAHLLSDRALA
jgi:hypothetical protein